MANREINDSPIRTARLIAGFLQGNLTQEESAELDKWIAASDDNMQLFEKLTDRNNVEWSMQWFSQMDVRASFQQLQSKIYKRNKRSGFIILRRCAAAAAIVAIVSALLYLFYVGYPYKSSDAVATSAVTLPVGPGTFRAILAGDDGKEYDLAAQHAAQIRAGDSTVEHTKGLLSYENADPRRITIHELRVPRGGEYQLLLSDGTRAWLNAESSIKYPTYFTGDTRTVELTGEGYFEVKHDRNKPFFVKTPGVAVEVKGTVFNVHAYPGETMIYSLVSGSIDLISSNERLPLKPHEEASLRDGKVVVRQRADIEDAFAWKNGKFSFRDEPLTSVMEEISRWYDIEVKYENRPDIKLTGEIRRNSTLQQVISMLSQSGDIHCTVVGRTVTLR